MPRNFDNIIPPGTYAYPGSNGDFGPRTSPTPGASSDHRGYGPVIPMDSVRGVSQFLVARHE